MGWVGSVVLDFFLKLPCRTLSDNDWTAFDVLNNVNAPLVAVLINNHKMENFTLDNAVLATLEALGRSMTSITIRNSTFITKYVHAYINTYSQTLFFFFSLTDVCLIWRGRLKICGENVRTLHLEDLYGLTDTYENLFNVIYSLFPLCFGPDMRLWGSGGFAETI